MSAAFDFMSMLKVRFICSCPIACLSELSPSCHSGVRLPAVYLVVRVVAPLPTNFNFFRNSFFLRYSCSTSSLHRLDLFLAVAYASRANTEAGAPARD